MGSISRNDSHISGFDVDQILSQLSIDEKIALLSGSDPWHTAPIARLSIPKLRLTDGPNGVRGTKFFNGVPAACLPCGTALGSTWDTDLIWQGGVLQATEAIAKGASVILGPTTNMQRSPLGGRGFESFSEDPVLAGSLSAATINGIQSMGVAATLKHYVCNDQEHERQSMDVVVSERALREIYLAPFQIAERDSKPMCIMTSYNKVNGIHASSSKRLIQDILRQEWGFDGVVVSDWFGTYSTSDAIKAGLDLEMPGPTYIRGQLIKHALGCGLLLPQDIDARVKEVLKLVQKLLPLGIPEDAPEETVNTTETSQLLRRIGTGGLVLLKNESNVLPFSRTKTTAVIGPNANFAAYCGGGSASILPYYTVTPLQGIQKYVENAEYKLGAPGWKKIPLLSNLVTRLDGKNGFDVDVFLEHPANTTRSLVDSFSISDSDIFLADYKNDKIQGNLFFMELSATMVPDCTAEFEFSLSVSGTGKLFVDSECIIDNMTPGKQKPGDSFFGSGTVEALGSVKMEKGRCYRINISFGTLPTRTYSVSGGTASDAGGLRAGGYRKIDPQREIEAAVELARRVDQVVVCAGLNSDWESEGYDRQTMDLPPGSDDLIRAVAAANPNTAVVMQSGTPVTMPWLSSVPALVQAWYGGNETGNAIADVLFGAANPSGKLSLSFPLRNEDNPAFLNFRSERGRTVYGEGVYVGYRFYEKTKREVAFPFGHGLSYTDFALESLSLKEDGDELVVTVDVSNTGPRATDGAQVVQVYVAQQSPSISRPVKELRGFTKVFVPAGEKRTADVRMLRKYATSFWDEEADAWIEECGKYTVLVGDSSANTPLTAEFCVAKTSYWRGL